MFYPIAQLQNKVIIDPDTGDPCIVTKFVFSKVARGGGVAKCSLKNLKTGANLQKSFQGNDKVEAADVGYIKCQYLYKEGDNYVFMNNETYEQFEISEDNLETQKYFLLEGVDVDVQMFQEQPISVNLKPKMELKVIETDPGVRGDTAGAARKSANLETGLVVQVPLFINEGDTIRVNTESLEYCERVQ